MKAPVTRRELIAEERRLGVNLPGGLRDRLLTSNGGLCTVDAEAWTLFAVSAAGSPAAARGTFEAETERLRADLGDRMPDGLVLCERLVGPGYLLLTPKGRLVRWDPDTGESTVARVDWSSPVPEPRHRRRRVPDTIIEAVERARADPGRSVTLKLPALDPAIVMTTTDEAVVATTGGGRLLPASALHAIGGSIDPQLMALGWRREADATWTRRWAATQDAKTVARAITDTFDAAYGLRAEMAEAVTTSET